MRSSCSLVRIHVDDCYGFKADRPPGLVNVVLFIATRRVLPVHSVITRRITLPKGIPVPAVLRNRNDSEGTLVGSTTKTIAIEVDLEKATYIDHAPIDADGGFKHEESMSEYPATNGMLGVNHLAVPPVSPLRPENVMSATTTTRFPNSTFPNAHKFLPAPPGLPSPRMPVPAPAPTPANARRFHDIPLDTPVPGHHTIGDDRGDSDSDYTASPSTAGYAVSSPGTAAQEGTARMSALPVVHSEEMHGHEHGHDHE